MPFKSDRQRKAAFANMNSGKQGINRNQTVINSNPQIKSKKIVVRENPKQKPFNEVDSIIAWEEGRLNDRDTIRLFQHLENTGRAYHLQGTYGRTAVAMIGAGIIKPNKKIHSPEQIKSYKTKHNLQRSFNDF